MIKNLIFLIPLIVSLIYTSPLDTLDYSQRKRRKAPAAYLDVQSGAQRTISTDRSHIHNYEAYSYNKMDTLGDNETATLAFYTGSKHIHLKTISFWSEKSPNLVYLRSEYDTLRMSTDTITPHNRNRDGNLNNNLFFSGCIVTDSVDTVGIEYIDLDPNYFGGGTTVGQKSYAGSLPTDIEWNFGPDQYFIICLKNLSGETALTTLCVFWYELFN